MLKDTDPALASSGLPAALAVGRGPRRGRYDGEAPRAHTHLDIDGRADASELLARLRGDCGVSDSLSVAIPSSLLRERHDSLGEVIGRCRLLFVIAESDGDGELPAGARWAEISRGRVLIVCSPLGVICYVDSIPCFAYRRGVGHPSTNGSSGALVRDFLAEFMAGTDISSSIALACEGARGERRLKAEAGPGTGAGARAAAVLELIEMNSSPRLFKGAASDYLRRVAACDEVVDASAVYAVRDGSLLMAKKLPQKSIVPGLWYLPGGKFDECESPEACARRELFEETGVRGEDYELLGVTLFPDPRDPSRLFRFHQYVLHDPSGAATPKDDIISCAWIPISEITRSTVFEITWAGLFVGRLTGAL